MVLRRLVRQSLRQSVRQSVRQSARQWVDTSVRQCVYTSVRAASTCGNVVADGVEAKPFEDIPGPRGIYQIPYIGTLFHFKPFSQFTPTTSNQFFHSLFLRYGPLVKLRIGRVCVVTSDPKDIETVYRNEGRVPLRPSVDLLTVYAKRNGYKDNLSNLNGEEWSALRTPANKRLMKADSAEHYLPQHNVIADELVDVMSTESLEGPQLEDLLFRYSSESIGVVAFNARLGFMNRGAVQDPEALEFLEASKELFRCLHKVFVGESVFHAVYRNKTYRAFERAYNVIKRQTKQHIKQAYAINEQRSREGTASNDESNLLLSLVSGKDVTEEDICAILEALYSSSTDAIARNLLVFLYNLANHPEKQKVLREEIHNVVGKNKMITAEHLKEMHYLKACLKESFRINYPTSLGSMRILPTDVVLSGFRIPAGVPILFGNPTACRLYFQDADKFLPERWLRSQDGRTQQSIPNMALLPFGHGPRMCIGQRFALQELHLTTAKILQKLSIDVTPESRGATFHYNISPFPNKPIRFVFTPDNSRV